MNDTNNKFRIFLVIMVWLVILGSGAVLYRLWWQPRTEKIAEVEEKKEKEFIFSKTTASKRFQHEPKFATDGFSGYALLRSSTFADEAAKYNIGLNNFYDDNANYKQRFESLASGDTNMAVFTIDALVKASHDYGDLPVTIVDIFDETRGADSMLGSKEKFPNIDALNNPDLKIVCVKDTPSETLGRVVMAYFNLTKIDESNFEFLDSPSDVYEAYKDSKPIDNKVFILWEPYVSMVLTNDKYRSIVNSSKFRGYIVDVIVANRDYLVKYRSNVINTIKSFRTTMFKRRNDMEDLVIEDSKLLGDSWGGTLDSTQAKKLVEGIWWKNTQESFGHFGLTSGHDLQHMEEMIKNITDVLIKTGSIKSDPTKGEPNLLYYDGIIKELYDSSWHPGFGHEQIRREKALLALSDKEWEELIPVGTLQIKKLVFARGTSRLSSRSLITLDDLAEKLTTWPQYYLVIRGNASKKGLFSANQSLATARAKSATEYLIQKGIDKNRIRAESGEPDDETTVTFTLGELSY